jgi:putative GTP pyrophosphokinase
MTFDEEYNAVIEPLDEFGRRVQNLLEDLLHRQRIEFHSVRYRVKQKESANRKLKTQGGQYASVGDLRDMLGLRVITHFADHVDSVGRMVRAEFHVDPAQSVDKGKLLDPDRFGYRSQHYIAELSRNRARLPEWERFLGLSFEIQIRSILQHSWAEIEHDLGYKSPTAIPPTIRRRFSRLAGVLELADDEFQGIRRALDAHAKSVDSSVKAGRDIPIDQDSIQALVTTSPIVRRLDQRIAEGWGLPLSATIDPNYAAIRAEELIGVGIESTDELLGHLETDEDRLVEFAVGWFRRPSARYKEPFSSVSPGISMFYLFLHLELQRGTSPDDLKMFNGKDDEEWQAFLNLHDSIYNA